MVKFGKWLVHNSIPEWSTQYVDYKGLKKMLNLVRIKHRGSTFSSQPGEQYDVSRNDPDPPEAPEAPSAGNNAGPEGSELVQGAMAACPPNLYFSSNSIYERDFFAAFEANLRKVENFYLGRVQEFEAAVTQVERQLELAVLGSKPKNPLQSARHFRQTLLELVKGFELLENFATTNYLACVKIMKKHDKACRWSASPYVLEHVKECHFRHPHEAQELKKLTEEVIIAVYYKGDRKAGLMGIRQTQNGDSTSAIFSVGLNTGVIFSALLALIFYIAAGWTEPWTSADSDWHAESIIYTWPVFRCALLVCLHVAIFGCNLLVWSEAKVNYRFIFGLDASVKERLTWSSVLRFAQWVMLFIMLCFAMHLLRNTTRLFGSTWWPSHWFFSFLLVAAALLLLLTPFEIPGTFYHTRKNFWRTVLNICRSGTVDVELCTFFMADQLTSQIRALGDLGYTACYYFSGQFIDPHDGEGSCAGEGQFVISAGACLLPYFFRMAQELRRAWRACSAEYHRTDRYMYLLNAGKYATSLITVSLKFAGFGVLPLVVLSTVYSYSWDILKDWGLCRFSNCSTWGSCTFVLMNKDRCYPRWFYYWAIVSNAMLRVTWAFLLVPQAAESMHAETQLLVLAVLEIVRRGQWNLIRIENEHVNNCGKFRVVREIPMLVEADTELENSADSIPRLAERDRALHLMARQKSGSSRNTDELEGGGGKPPSCMQIKPDLPVDSNPPDIKAVMEHPKWTSQSPAADSPGDSRSAALSRMARHIYPVQAPLASRPQWLSSSWSTVWLSFVVLFCTASVLICLQSSLVDGSDSPGNDENGDDPTEPHSPSGSSFPEIILSVAGSSTVYPIAKAWETRYSQLNDNILFTARGGGSSVGAYSVCHTATDIGDMSREFLPSEAMPHADGVTYQCVRHDEDAAMTCHSGYCSPRHDYVTQWTVGRDIVSAFVATGGSADACISRLGGLSFAQLRWIYSSLDTSQLAADGMNLSSTVPNDDFDDDREWSDLGSYPECLHEKIEIWGPDSGSGTQLFFKELVMWRGSETQPEHAQTVEDEGFGRAGSPLHHSRNDNYIIAGVIESGQAIGFVSYAYVQQHQFLTAAPISKEPTLGAQDEAAAPALHPSHQSYHMRRPLFMNVNLEQREKVRGFLTFGFSEEGTRLVEQNGYIPLSPSELTATRMRLNA
eukprot:gene13937-16474_t